jgi:hypothetical protein
VPPIWVACITEFHSIRIPSVQIFHFDNLSWVPQFLSQRHLWYEFRKLNTFYALATTYYSTCIPMLYLFPLTFCSFPVLALHLLGFTICLFSIIPFLFIGRAWFHHFYRTPSCYNHRSSASLIWLSS